MTKIIISNCIEIREPSNELLQYVKKELTFKNPQFEKRKRLGYYAYGTPKEVKLYNYYNNVIYTPVGFFNKLFKMHPKIDDYIDYSVEVHANIKSNIKLRDYQELAIPSVINYKTGILNLPVGLGKTELALECINRVQQKTIWLSHTGDLLNQSLDRCRSKMKCKTSTITEGKCDLSGDIVFATVQTLYKYVINNSISQNTFGMLILDECHHISANPNSIQLFRTCVDYFACKYKIGLTATVHRADGMEDCIKAILGDIIYKIEKRDAEYCCIYEDKTLLRFPIDKFQVPARIKVIETDYNLEGKEVFAKNGGTIQFASLISDIAKNEERNKVIIDKLNEIEGSTIVLSDRVEQLKYLCSRVDNGVQIDGSTPKKLRAKALDDVRSGKVKYLFASYSLAKEGLSVDVLSNLVMATPVKDFAIVSQSIGRIQRPFEGKTIATVYDFVDKVGMLRNFYAKRRSIYRKNKWDIENIYLGG